MIFNTFEQVYHKTDNMKNYSHLFILYVSIIGCIAPQKTYLDQNWEKCQKKEASYFRTAKKKGELYLVKDMYMNGKMQMFAECSAIEPKLIYNGKVTRYDEMGRIVSSGNYKDGVQYGLWMRINNKTMDTTYVDYYLDGSFDYHPKATNYSKPEEFSPQYLGGSSAIKELIYKNLKYPEASKNKRTGGKLDLHFTIDTSGKISNIVPANSLDSLIDKEGIRLISLLNNWVPATKSGKKISVNYAIPILFFPDKKFEDEYNDQEAQKKMYKVFFDIDRKVVDSAAANFYTIYYGADTTGQTGTNETFLMTGILLSKTDYTNKEGKREETITYYYESGKIRSVQHTVEGKTVGEFLVYHPNGKIKRKEIYREGEFKQGYAYTKYGKDTTFREIDERQAFFPGWEKGLNKYVEQNFVYPKKLGKKNIKGVARVGYTIDKYGNVKNVTLISGVHPLLDAELIRVIQSMPKWIPGYMRDHAISFYHTYSVRFGSN